MFFGGYDHKIDKKGRVFIPASFREELGESFIICKSIYGKHSLGVYPNEQWKELVKTISSAAGSKSIGIKRFLFEGAFTVELDTQGRILVPPPLRDYGEFGGDVHIIGMDTNFEIWDSEKWKVESEQNTFESVFAAMEELNI